VSDVSLLLLSFCHKIQQTNRQVQKHENKHKNETRRFETIIENVSSEVWVEWRQWLSHRARPPEVPHPRMGEGDEATKRQDDSATSQN
jgi:hypothetical protein